MVTVATHVVVERVCTLATAQGTRTRGIVREPMWSAGEPMWTRTRGIVRGMGQRGAGQIGQRAAGEMGQRVDGKIGQGAEIHMAYGATALPPQ